MKNDTIRMAHGSGGGMSRELIEQEILPRFGDGPLCGLPDAALLKIDAGDLLFTTDSFVVQPLFFPGGNIGDLCVHGTVNDISVSGGEPVWMSLGLILEEGLPLDSFRCVLDSIRKAADQCGVRIVTGDTKVVNRGQCDGIYVNTAGIGRRLPGFEISADRISVGDHVVVSGTLGDHGMAVIAAREGIDISPGPVSDTGPVNALVSAVAGMAAEIWFMRDPTRGGLAGVLTEAVSGGAVGILLREQDIPYSPATRAAAELLGLDPMVSACEGRVIAVCSASCSERILAAWRELPEGASAAVIGEVTDDRGLVSIETMIGGRRLVDVPRGELLPRIC